ncbi:hypothetical protein [Mesorhizobium sp. M0586]|uniref:hypothetical protein n=1 Tax=Mesorhizobium sp. M0586 TaxID=2956963 RepID=UPI00333BB1B6
MDEILASVAIFAGLSGLIASAISAFISAKAKKNVTLKLLDSTIAGTLTFDPKSLSAAEAERIIDMLGDAVRKREEESGIVDRNGGNNG